MKCPKCKKRIKSGDKFCENCGEKLPLKKKMNSKVWLPVGIGGICLLIILLVIFFINPQKTEANKLQEKLDLGDKYLASAEYEKAEVAFDEALKIDEKSPDAAIGLAKVYNNKKDPEKALTYLKKASDNLDYAAKEKKDSDLVIWKEKSENYGKVYDQTSALFLERGNETKAEETIKEKEKADNSITIIIQYAEKPIEEPADNKNLVQKGGQSEAKEDDGSKGDTSSKGDDSSKEDDTSEEDDTSKENDTSKKDDSSKEDNTSEADKTSEVKDTNNIVIYSSAQIACDVKKMPYIGNGSYQLSACWKQGEYGEQPIISGVDQPGVMAAVELDLDEDGNNEILAVTYEPGNLSSGMKTIHLSVLKQSTTGWVILTEAEVVGQDFQGNFYDASRMSETTLYSNGVVFLRKYNGKYEMYYENYGEGVFATGQSWFLKGFRFENDMLMEIPETKNISYEGSPIDELWSQTYEQLAEYDSATALMMQNYCSLGFAWPYITYDEMTSDQNPSLYCILKINMSSEEGTDSVMNWMQNHTDSLNIFTLSIEDYGQSLPENIEEYVAVRSQDATGQTTETDSETDSQVPGFMIEENEKTEDNSNDEGNEEAGDNSTDEENEEPEDASNDEGNVELGENPAGVNSTESEENPIDIENVTGEENTEPKENLIVEEVSETEELFPILSEESYSSEEQGESDWWEQQNTQDEENVGNSDGEGSEAAALPKTDVQEGGETLPEEAVDISEEVIDVSEEAMDIQGENVDVSEETEDMLGENANVSEETEITQEELLNAYIENDIPVQYSWSSCDGTGIAYNYSDGTSSVSGLNGIVGIQKEDFDSDGNPELFVISLKSGRISFDIYKAADGNVNQTASVTAICDGFGTALDRMNYGCTQEFFIRNEGGSCLAGIASSYYGANDGSGNPETVINMELYEISAEGSASLKCAVSMVNGMTVYTNGDKSNGSGGGKEAFLASLSQNGMSGEWIHNYADSLTSMDLSSNPEQDLSSVPGPLDSGLAMWEPGVQDLVTVTADMGAGSSFLNVNLQDNTVY